MMLSGSGDPIELKISMDNVEPSILPSENEIPFNSFLLTFQQIKLLNLCVVTQPIL